MTMRHEADQSEDVRFAPPLRPGWIGLPCARHAHLDVRRVYGSEASVGKAS